MVSEDTGTVTTMDITAKWGDTLRPGRRLPYFFYDTVFVQSLAEFDMILHLSNLIFDPCRPLSCYSASATSVISGEFFFSIFVQDCISRQVTWQSRKLWSPATTRRMSALARWKKLFFREVSSLLPGGPDCVKQFQQ